MRTFHTYPVVLLVAMIALIATSAPPPAQVSPSLPEPNARYDKGEFLVGLYGDGESIRLFLGLVKDNDPLVRERAATELGQTDNRQAAAPLLSMLADADLGVRCVTIDALTRIDPNLARAPATAALAAPEPRLVLAALRAVRDLKLAETRQAVEKVLSRKEPMLAAAALQTLTDLGSPAPTDLLKALLEDSSIAVRLCAAQNAMLCPAGGGPAETLLKLAGDANEQSQVRAAAMAALGKIASPSVEPLLAAAAKAGDPALRRGALWAWRHAGKGDRIRPFLEDESPMVVLAAIEAAGALKQADCMDGLLKILISAVDEQTHFAARDALADLGVAAVADRAAEELRKAAPALVREVGPSVERTPGPPSPGGPGPRRGPETAPAAPAPSPTPAPSPAAAARLMRNVRSCSWLLGHYRSKAALDVQMDLITRLPVDSGALVELAGALAKIGDERGAGPIRQALAVAAAHAPGYLAFMKGTALSFPPFSEKVTAALIDAAADLQDASAVPVIISLADANFQGTTLRESAAAAARALPRLVSDSNRQPIEKAVTRLLGARKSHGPQCNFESCKAAAKLKMSSAVPLLQEVLKERECRQVIYVSAWALGSLTGQTPPLLEPVRREGNLWTVKVHMGPS